MENQSLTVKNVKREAKGLLSNNWSRALSVLCISLLALSAFMLINRFVISLVELVTQLENDTQTVQPQTLTDYYEKYKSEGLSVDVIISVILTVFYFLIVSPLQLGVVNWYQSLAICGNLQVGQVFYYYRTNDLFTGALVFELARLVRHVISLVVSLAPSVLCFGAALNMYLTDAANNNEMLTLLIAGGVALLIIGLIVYAMIMLRWFVAKYLYVGGHGYGAQDCFRYSARYMKGQIGKVFSIFVSCVPLWLVCLLVLPAVFIIPYCNAILAAAAQDIIDDNMSE